MKNTEQNSNYYAVIMAGGVGSRFWPVSTSEFPKQFHDMLGAGQTLIQKTYSRLIKIVPSENILILTNERYKDIVLEQLPLVLAQQILLEPVMRNTAPCILYAALKIQKINPDAVMVVAPSDHWIEDEVAFCQNLEACFSFSANNNALLTLGIQPTFPNTGFGYIEYDKSDDKNIKTVIQFREKPNYQTAVSFLESGNFLWNGGIFIWSIASILESFQKFQPAMMAIFIQGVADFNTEREQDFINKTYAFSENISIDYAILEPAKNVFVLPATFDWNDLGTWGSLHDKLIKDGNLNAIVNAKTVLHNASNNMISTQKNKLVIIDGLSDYIIVDKDNILLIYPKSKEQDIKSIVNSLA